MGGTPFVAAKAASSKPGRSDRQPAPKKRSKRPPLPPKAPPAATDQCQPGSGEQDTEALILTSLADPGHRPLTIALRCELLGISRSTWYRHTSDPLFRPRAASAFRDAIGDAMGPVLEALVKSAGIVGRDGHPDRKLYLDLCGVTAGTAAGDDDDDKSKGKPGAEMSDAELLAAFAERPELIPPGVLRRMGTDPDTEKTNGDGTAR